MVIRLPPLSPGRPWARRRCSVGRGYATVAEKRGAPQSSSRLHTRHMSQDPDRLSALAHDTRAAADLDTLLDVVATQVAYELGADGSYIGRVDHRHGNVDILARAGVFKNAELWGGRDSYPIAEQSRAPFVGEEARLWSGTLADDLQPLDQEMLGCTGQGSAVSVPIIVDDR